ncbi:MAG: DUF3570 domain-containing protein [Kofleriaceae bacterium]
MRLQLALAGLLAATTPAAADGSVSARAVYYKERATRVMQPMLDGVFELGARGLVTSHFLVDAITSASSSAGAANAVAFTENRYEAGVGYTHELSDLKLSGESKYSTESDYRSFYLGGRGELELFQKNTTLGIGGGVGFDTISAGSGGGLAQPTIECEMGTAEQAECKLRTYSVFASATQILSPRTLVGASVDVSKLDGYQSNPYRSAIAGDELVPERHPTERTREAFAGLVRHFVKQTDTTLIGAYRYYRDTWKVHAHTPELRVIQQVGTTIDASFRYRYHTQDSAFFYKARYASVDEENEMSNTFFSDDVKLSDTSTHTLEAKLGLLGETFELEGTWGAARFEAVLQYVVQYNRFGNAIIAHIGVTVPFSY